MHGMQNQMVRKGVERMKTPEEIKRSLKSCTDVCYGRCKECVYGENDPSECVLRLSGDALAYIIRLEAERDAAEWET